MLNVFTHINHKRIYIKEKSKLVEENLAQNNKNKKVLKAEMNVLIQGRMKLAVAKNWMKRQMKLCEFVFVISIAVLCFFNLL